MWLENFQIEKSQNHKIVIARYIPVNKFISIFSLNNVKMNQFWFEWPLQFYKALTK